MIMNYIKGFKTKSLKSVKDSDRIFEGVSTVEMVDMDGEITSRDMMLKQFQTWMDRGAPISDRHSNRIIGKGISFAPVEVDDAKSKKKFYGIKLRGKIFKDHMLDNKVWQAIKSGAYKGLSYGGANLANREPVKQIDGTMAYKLNDVELYEVSVCPEPSAPLALITDFNRLAKSMTAEELSGMDVTEREDGKVAMKCDKFRCYVPKNEQMEGIVGLNNTHDIAKSKMVEHEDDKKIEAKTEEESEDKKDKSIDRLIGVVSKFVDKSIEQNKAFEERFTALESKIKDSTHMSPAQGAKVKLPQTYNDNAPGSHRGLSLRHRQIPRRRGMAYLWRKSLWGICFGMMWRWWLNGGMICHPASARCWHRRASTRSWGSLIAMRSRRHFTFTIR